MTAPQKPSVIKFFCPCGQRVSVPVSLAGKSGACPKCKAPLKVPAASQPAEPPTARGPATSRAPTRPMQTDPAPAETCSMETEEMPVAGIPFVCPKCGYEGQAAPSFAGKEARCRCGNPVPIASLRADDTATESPSKRRSDTDRRTGTDRRHDQAPIDPAERICPHCREPVSLVDRKCGHCSRLLGDLGEGSRDATLPGWLGVIIGVLIAGAIGIATRPVPGPMPFLPPGAQPSFVKSPLAAFIDGIVSVTGLVVIIAASAVWKAIVGRRR